MADQQKSQFEYDDWVGAVRPDPRNTDKLTLLQGFIGQSSETGHIRVYSDETLNSFVEVPEEAIVYAQKLNASESSLGGSKLWLRSDSVVTYGDPKAANRPKSTFLEGDIMQQYAAFGQPDTTMMGAAMAAGQPDTTGGGGVQAMATLPQILCAPLTRVSVCQICFTRNVSCVRSICNQITCFRTICQVISCNQTICGPKSCIPILCGGIPCQGGSQIPGTVSIACGPGGIGGGGGPVIQQGAGMMGGQPDTTQMGGYYGMFNPYMY
ncbi:hypothetical protein [Spirosoma sp. KNUC1025]|uniref:hypothetical protein n=1 Tax=Spirosoma sp. KNUC1025 TaxID=2894082 RepID=UPI00386EBCD3|nr:hypothetical protein LN737_00745 [Spirosoma sp. KNUC1025]